MSEARGTGRAAGAPAVDLNTDLGELAALWEDGTEEGLLRVVTAVNVACGGHAGDERSMRRTAARALALGVAVGAHPSYPDREGFGRVAMAIGREALGATVERQVRALAQVVADLGGALRHVKPHGALYHDAASDPAVAETVAAAAARIDPALALVGFAGSAGLARWRELGATVLAEGFADRGYEVDGSLRSRGRPGASIEDPVAAAAQALRLAHRGAVDTICVHSDTRNAVAIATAVRRALDS